VLEVAAFRSVGIPARLNESGRAELFSEGKMTGVAGIISFNREDVLSFGHSTIVT